MTGLRITWVQPEDLVGHELRQASEDGRDASGIAATWHTAGGPRPPALAGASPIPAGAGLRTLAATLLDDLARMPSPLAALEPTRLPDIVAACPLWPGAATPQAARPVPPGGPGAGSPVREGAGWGNHRPAAGHLSRDPDLGGGGPPHEPREHTEARPDDRPQDHPHPDGPGDRLHPDPLGDPLHADPLGDRLHADGPGDPLHADPLGDPLHADPLGDHLHPDRLPDQLHPHGLPDHLHPNGPGDPLHPDRLGDPLHPDPLQDRLHAAWLGRAVGCLLGKPVEKLPLPAIRALARATGNWPLTTWFTARGVPAPLLAAHPWNRRSAPTSLAENIDGMPEDDDLNYPLLNLLLLQRHGRSFRTADVAALWLDELPAGRTFTAERVAYRNLLSGIEPPLTASHHNPFREWIGAAIRADLHGWTNPGDPAAAAAQAHRDAALTHTASGVHGAMFVAATIATATTGTVDVHQCLADGLTVVPPRSRLAAAVRLGIETAAAHTDFDTVVDRLHTAFGHYHWVHVIPNAALLAAALTHADGDFTGSICRAVSGGWDTDSNGATAGSVAGLLAGHPAALPDRWTAPLKNRLATSVSDFDGIGFDTLAQLTLQEALRP